MVNSSGTKTGRFQCKAPNLSAVPSLSAARPGAARCSGHCCKAFTIPASLEEMRADYQRWIDWSQDQSKPSPKYQEIHIIYPMVIYLGRGWNSKADGSFVPLEEGRADGFTNEPTFVYTCKHHDVKTGNCSIYEHRPRMCRDFPYGSSCPFGTCTYKPTEIA